MCFDKMKIKMNNMFFDNQDTAKVKLFSKQEIYFEPNSAKKIRLHNFSHANSLPKWSRKAKNNTTRKHCFPDVIPSKS